MKLWIVTSYFVADPKDRRQRKGWKYSYAVMAETETQAISRLMRAEPGRSDGATKILATECEDGECIHLQTTRWEPK